MKSFYTAFFIGLKAKVGFVNITFFLRLLKDTSVQVLLSAFSLLTKIVDCKQGCCLPRQSRASNLGANPLTILHLRVM